MGGIFSMNNISGQSASSITAHLKNSTGETRKAKAAIYDNASPRNLIGYTEEVDVISAQDGWLEFGIIGEVGLTANATYFLCVWSEGYHYQTTNIFFGNQSGETGVIAYAALEYTDFPAELSTSAGAEILSCIFCNYSD